MNPSNREVGPNFELPPDREGLERQREKSMEERPAQEKTIGQDKSPASDIATYAPPVVAPTSGKPDDHMPSTTSVVQDVPTAGLVAHDVDLIEKHWVESAKAIVNQTKDDPYKQKRAMGKVKADYIKKRFNKTITTDDAVAA